MRRGLLIAVAIACAVQVFYTIVFGAGVAPAFHHVEAQASEGAVVDLSGGYEHSFVAEGRRLESIALTFSSAPKGEEDVLGLKLAKDGYDIWGAKIPLAKVETGAPFELYVNTRLDPGEIYTLAFDASESGGPVALAAARDGSLALGRTYRLLPALGARLARAALCVLAWMLPACVIAFWDRIWIATRPLRRVLLRDGWWRLLPVGIELALAVVLVRFDKLLGEWSIVLGMALVSIIACVRLRESYALVRKHFDTPGKKLLLAVLILYGAFALVGSRTLVFPFNAMPTPAKIVKFFAAALWMAAPVLSFLALVWRSPARLISQSAKRLPTGAFLALVISIIVVPLAFALIAFNPLIGSPDTRFSVVVALRLYETDPWIPLLYKLFVRAGLELWSHLSVLAIEQWVFWTYVVVRGLFSLRRRGVRDGVLIAIAAGISLAPANWLQVNTGWKDIPFACSLLWLAITMADVLIPARDGKSGWFVRLELALALAGTALFRHNGIVSAFVSIVMLLADKGRRRNLAPIALALAAVLAIQGPLTSYLRLKTNLGSEDRMYSGFGLDLVGMQQAGADLPPEAAHFLMEVTRDDVWGYAYMPTYYNFWSLDNVDHDLLGFVAFMAESVARNPLLFARATIARNDLVWGVLPGVKSDVRFTAWTGSEPIDGRALGVEAPERRNNELTFALQRVSLASRDILPLNVLFWRCGFWVLLALTAMLALHARGCGREALVLGALLIAQIVGLWLSSGYGGEFRFYWPDILLSQHMLAWAPVVLAMRAAGKGQQ